MPLPIAPHPALQHTTAANSELPSQIPSARLSRSHARDRRAPAAQLYPPHTHTPHSSATYPGLWYGMVIPATSSRPRLLAFLDPRRSRRAGGSEPAGPRAPPPLLDHLVKQHAGPGLNPSRFDQRVKLVFRAGRTRAHLVRAWGTSRRRIVGDSTPYHPTTLSTQRVPSGPTQQQHPTLPGGKRPHPGLGSCPAAGWAGGFASVKSALPSNAVRPSLMQPLS